MTDTALTDQPTQVRPAIRCQQCGTTDATHEATWEACGCVEQLCDDCTYTRTARTMRDVDAIDHGNTILDARGLPTARHARCGVRTRLTDVKVTAVWL